jgi:hypothetical protein
MELLDDIIDLAASDTGSVATLLRKCLVLAHTLRNDRLLTWAENELERLQMRRERTGVS